MYSLLLFLIGRIWPVLQDVAHATAERPAHAIEGLAVESGRAIVVEVAESAPVARPALAVAVPAVGAAVAIAIAAAVAVTAVIAFRRRAL